MRSAIESAPVHDLAAPLVGDLPPNSHVRHWLAECVKLCRPKQVQILDGSSAEKRGLLKRAVADGVLIRLNQDKLPGCYLHRSNPNDVARTEQCTFICTPKREPGRPHQQLDAAPRGLRQAARPVRRLHARPDHVRRPVRHGAARLAAGPGRRAADRLDLRRHQHGHHDAHGRGGLASSSATSGRLHPLPALASATATRSGATSATFPRTTPSGASAPATAATPCWARNAWPCASPASWATSKAGWPSTCCSWA